MRKLPFDISLNFQISEENTLLILFESSAGLRILTSGVTAENDYLGFFLKDEDIQKGDKVVWNSLDLFVKPVSPVFDSTKIHHKEVYMGLSET